jgi:hypothetical protein
VPQTKYFSQIITESIKKKSSTRFSRVLKVAGREVKVICQSSRAINPKNAGFLKGFHQRRRQSGGWLMERAGQIDLGQAVVERV